MFCMIWFVDLIWIAFDLIWSELYDMFFKFVWADALWLFVDVLWLELVWCECFGMLWFNLFSLDVTCCDWIWFVLSWCWFHLIWFEWISYDPICFDLICCSLVCFELTWFFDLFWLDLIWLCWFVLIWFHSAWLDLISFDSIIIILIIKIRYLPWTSTSCSLETKSDIALQFLVNGMAIILGDGDGHVRWRHFIMHS